MCWISFFSSAAAARACISIPISFYANSRARVVLCAGSHVGTFSSAVSRPPSTHRARTKSLQRGDITAVAEVIFISTLGELIGSKKYIFMNKKKREGDEEEVWKYLRSLVARTHRTRTSWMLCASFYFTFFSYISSYYLLYILFMYDESLSLLSGKKTWWKRWNL